MANTPDPNTSYIMDTITRQLSRLEANADIYVALCEYATALFNPNHTLDIGFGFNDISAMYTIADMVVGQGVYRVNGSTIPSVFPDDSYKVYPWDSVEYPAEIYYTQYLTEYPIDIQAELTGQLENVYVFASLYFSPNDSKIGIQLVCGDGGLPIMMVRDLNMDTIVQMVEDDIIPETTNMPLGSIELFKIIIDVKYFSETGEDRANRINLVLVDKRRLRGWAGFMEENMASYLIPPLIRYRNSILSMINSNSYGNSVHDKIVALVNVWKNLSWLGGFDQYWANNSYDLPSDIAQYV